MVVNVGELKAALDDYGDHVKVVVDIDRTIEEEETFDVVEVSSATINGEVFVRIEWG